MPEDIAGYSLILNPTDAEGVELLEAVYSNGRFYSFSVMATAIDSANADPAIDVEFSFWRTGGRSRRPVFVDTDRLAKLIDNRTANQESIRSNIEQVGQLLAARVKNCLAR